MKYNCQIIRDDGSETFSAELHAILEHLLKTPEKMTRIVITRIETGNT